MEEQTPVSADAKGIRISGGHGSLNVQHKETGSSPPGDDGGSAVCSGNFINHLGEAAMGLTFREIRVRPTLCPTLQRSASVVLVGNFSNLLNYQMVWKHSTAPNLCIQLKVKI